ncbi:unnamed protein product, partial [Dicrocoelium dendriticum]
PDKTLISAAVSGCGEDECDLDGGDRIAISIVFKPKLAVHSGRAKLCGMNTKPIMYEKRVAAIPDICEYIKPNCPMEPGRVYTDEHILRTANVS